MEKKFKLQDYFYPSYPKSVTHNIRAYTLSLLISNQFFMNKNAVTSVPFVVKIYDK